MGDEAKSFSKERDALIKLLSFSVDDSKQGRVISSVSFKDRLAKRKNEAKERLK